jgi:hypothetical protein
MRTLFCAVALLSGTTALAQTDDDNARSCRPGSDDHAGTGDRTSGPGPDNGADGIKPATRTASRISALFRHRKGSVHSEFGARIGSQGRPTQETSRLTLTESRGIG